ncbi:hypothetical protein MAR_029829, partial [Mya arenaria]
RFADDVVRSRSCEWSPLLLDNRWQFWPARHLKTATPGSSITRILLGVVDGNYNFLWTDVGATGREPTEPERLPGNDRNIPFFLMGTSRSQCAPG